MRGQHYYLGAGLLALVGLAGCGKATPAESAKKGAVAVAKSEPASKAAGSSDKDKLGAPTKAVEPRSPELEVSKPKEYKSETDANALGLVPDGIGLRPTRGKPSGPDFKPQMAPDFTALDSNGKSQTLDGFLAKGPALLVFYRGGW